MWTSTVYKVVNDIDVGLSNLISNFTDDTTTENWIIDDRDRLYLQENLRKLQKGPKDGKCPLMSIMPHSTRAYRNKKSEYEMNGVKIESVHCVQDLDVTIALNLKFSQQCKDAAG